MCSLVSIALNEIASVSYLELIKALAPVATAVIAFAALKNWKRQDKAKREAEFLDSLIDAAHTYIAEVPKPITLLQMAKIGMEAHAPTWESGDPADLAVKGAIAFIQKNGEHEAKRLFEALEAIQPQVIKLRSLLAKGQVFNFVDYAKCQSAIAMLTWHFDRLKAFAVVIGSPTWNWDHPLVLKQLKEIMAMDSDDILNSMQNANIEFLAFSSYIYKRIYGR
jgi:hypothetical protein